MISIAKPRLRLLTAGLLLSIACTGPAPPTEPVTGVWRATLRSPGGDLPFTLEIRETDGGLVATALNGPEEAPLGTVTVEGDRVEIRTDWYDSEIEATRSKDGLSLEGRWRKTVSEGDSVLAFQAVKGDERRFLPDDEAAGERAAEASAGSSVDGTWGVLFRDDEGEEKAVGAFEQRGETVNGTFLTPTGDYRYLAGDVRAGRLRLSTFDGAHAFLFHATVAEDGSLAGDFWSRDSYHATWEATRIEAEDTEAALPDPYDMVGLTNGEGRFRFALPDLDGHQVASSDERFAGKVVLVNLFGSWCPNCNDEAPLLARWYRSFRDEGLEIVGLAFEMSGDAERDRLYVRKYAQRHGIEYPLLLAGLSDKKAAAEALPDLDKVAAYPTCLFIGRDGRVRRIYSGFAGPGTGRHYDELVEELEGLIQSLLAEPEPTGAATATAL